MRIRKANKEDRSIWDSFSETQGGSFGYYFDCRYLSDNVHQLMIETDEHELVGICRFDKEEIPLYSTLRINGFLFRKSMSQRERYHAIREFLDYIEKNYSKRCSTFIVQESSLDFAGNDPNPALVDHGFRFRNYEKQGLPCSHILPLKAPFEENIWKAMWSQKLRQDLNKVARSGIKIIQDKDFKYLDIYLDMYAANYKRHKLSPPNRDRICKEISVFRDKIKLFVAIYDEQPITILKCNYSNSSCYLSGVGSYTKGTNDANKLCYKVAIEDACNNGFQFADFGYSYTEGLASLKDRFKFTRISSRMYEKRYSVPRVLFELTPGLIKSFFQNKTYVMKNGKVTYDRMIRW